MFKYFAGHFHSYKSSEKLAMIEIDSSCESEDSYERQMADGKLHVEIQTSNKINEEFLRFLKI